MRRLSSLQRTAVLACSIGVCLSPLAANADLTDDEKRELFLAFLEEDRHAIRRIAADQASQRIDFLDITYVDPDSDSGEGGLTVAYEWNFEESDRSVDVDDNGIFRMRRIAYGIDINGKYAFDDATNNKDLSKANVRFSLERGNYGEVRVIENAEAFKICLEDLESMYPEPTKPDDPGWDAYLKIVPPLEKACWTDYGIDEIVRGEDSTYLYRIDFKAGVEGNQDFSERNTQYGLATVLAAQPSREQRRYNVLDLPFRLIREGFMEDSNYVAPWPSLRLDIDRIDASDNDTRTALTTESDFTRGTAEIAFQTIVASVKNEPVRFNISYRYFHEFSAPQAIKDADLDSFDYTAMSFRFPARLVPFIETDNYELYLAYTSGQLPFDLESDKAFEIGFTTNISELAKLFDN